MEKNTNLNNKIEYDKINTAVNIIKDGGIVVFPTETVYGIGSDCLNENAIRKLYKAKRRPLTKKISLLVGSKDMLEQYTQNLSKQERKLIEEFFPGPLTLILHKNPIIPNLLTNNEDVVGFRMPKNKIALDIINALGNPIATSSANRSGEANGVNLLDIKNIFKDEVDFYIDGGKSEIGFGSTIVQIVDGKVILIREGIITKEDIEKVLKEVE